MEQAELLVSGGIIATSAIMGYLYSFEAGVAMLVVTAGLGWLALQRPP
jgi:hypothetical protein